MTTFQYSHSGSLKPVWYDEGTGPYAPMKYGNYIDPNSRTILPITWREKPMPEESKEGLFDKNTVYRNEGLTEVRVNYPCFVLRVDGTDTAAMNALSTYADHCDEPLATELREHVRNTPIRENDEEFLDDAEYMLNFETEGLTDDQYETLKRVIMMARESLQKNTGSLENTEKPVGEVLRELVELVVPAPERCGSEVWEHVVYDTRRRIRADFLSHIKMMKY